MKIERYLKLAANDFVKSIGLYVLAVTGSALIALVVSGLIGYLPYSDRPGPGWQARGWISVGEIGFYLGWLKLLVPYCLFLGLLFSAFARFLRWFRTPRWLIGLLAAPVCGFLTTFLVLGFGWYIALSGSIALFVGVVGLLFGGFVLPRYAGHPPADGISWKHSSITIVVTLAVVVLFGYPHWVNRHNQAMNVSFVEVVPGDETIDWSGKDLTKEGIAFLEGSGIRGKLRYGSSFSQSGDDDESARIFVVIFGPISRQLDLPQPKKKSVILLVRDDKWEMFPPGTATIPRKIRLTPSANGKIVHEIDGNSGRREF